MHKEYQQALKKEYREAYIGIIAFVIGIAVGAVVSHSMTAARSLEYRSSVDYSVEAIIADINETARQEDTDLLNWKLDLFEQRWKEYRAGGKSPERFAAEFQAVGKENR